VGTGWRRRTNAALVERIARLERRLQQSEGEGRARGPTPPAAAAAARRHSDGGDSRDGGVALSWFSTYVMTPEILIFPHNVLSIFFST